MLCFGYQQTVNDATDTKQRRKGQEKMDKTNSSNITLSKVLNSPEVRNFTKEILINSVRFDRVDAVKDIELALIVLRNELEGEK